MIQLLFNGQSAIFVLLLFTIILALSFHEFGHAWTAKMYGDDTATRLGRLTINPVAHIDPLGLMMIILVGFGWAKPVPTNPAKFNSFWASLVIAGAGPFANLLLAFLAINLYAIALSNGVAFVQTESASTFFYFFTYINVLLMLFNLIPLGPLDGHYILPYFLPRHLARNYRDLNQRYGGYAVLGLVLLSYAGLPVFAWLRAGAQWVMSALLVF
ncbi:MAG: site-2 protease family protein [Granulosicoccus sp.]|nr:site-2 protease family protein [Granulosicoccus sp.]